MSSALPYTDRRLAPPRKRRPWRGILVFLLLIAAFSAGYWMASEGIAPQQFFQAKKFNSPYHAYVHRLHDAGLDSLPLGQAWLMAGELALKDSQLLNLPVQMETFAAAAKPSALSFRFRATEGELITIQLDKKAGDEGKLFVELFQLREGHNLPRAVLSEVHLAGILTFEIEEDGLYIIRTQPEMLINLSYRLQVYKTASLAFPVLGKDRKAIMSFFGASRDGGRRKHKGVDIFAKKGTPVLAAADGRVSLRNGGLGGKTVWQRISGKSLYYAHLDSQYVRSGQEVKAGDTLGTVGNTGNARHTPPHLHFGIYLRGKGAVNPLAFIDTDLKKPEAAIFGQKEGRWVRAANKQLSLSQWPDRKAKEFADMKKHAPLFVKADLGKWLWVENTARQAGFVESHEIEPLEQAIANRELEAKKPFLHQADSCSAVMAFLQKGEKVVILAENSAFYLVSNAAQWGWIHK